MDNCDFINTFASEMEAAAAAAVAEVAAAAAAAASSSMQQAASHESGFNSEMSVTDEYTTFPCHFVM